MISPVSLFVYSRLQHTQLTVAALQKNLSASETVLIVFSDGPKKDDDKPKVKKIRDYIRTISGFKQVVLIEREKNCGLAENIISGVTQVTDEYGQVIVLEDDLITSPYFLSFMNDALNCYRDDEQVVSIHGYIYPVKKKLPDTFFIKGADCWGWATWKRGWELFNKNGSDLLQQITLKKKGKEFDFNNSYPYLQMLKDQIAGKNDSWAIRWYASAFLADKLTLYPGQSLVTNIGLDGSGTHCGEIDNMGGTISSTPICISKTDTIENIAARTAITDYFNLNKSGLFKKMIKILFRK